MDEALIAELLAKAVRLEGKMLFVKAADVYLSLEMREKAAEAYEEAGAYDKAIALFEKLGKKGDADRCRSRQEAARSGRTWADEQAEFQQDKGNPY